MTTYCTNIHPAESWQEIFTAVRQHVPVVKQHVSPESPFPLALRLSGRAAAEITRQDAEEFKAWCEDSDLYIATVNGFPYGRFHHTPIKESVYLPDWRYSERLDYTKKIADLLTLWLPADRTGSISTVPVGFRRCLSPEDFPEIQKNLRNALNYLDHLAQTTGKDILLAMEPEPGCILETTADVPDLFSRLDLSAKEQARLAVCFDCCHQALQFEDPMKSLQLLRENDIRIGQVQVSSALRLNHPDIAQLAGFHEPCYLHQTVGRKSSGELLRYEDLDQAITDSPTDIEEWRVHFHIPVFMEKTSECNSTRFFLEEILPLFPPGTPLEVETYTWSILPPELQTGTVTESIIREIEWVETIRNRQ